MLVILYLLCIGLSSHLSSSAVGGESLNLLVTGFKGFEFDNAVVDMTYILRS